MPRLSLTQAGSLNACAFLDMLAMSELGAELLRLSDDGYNVDVGATPTNLKLFPTLPDGTPDYHQHPTNFDQALDSTAAGRYQELAKNAVYYQALLGLADFSPVSQDLIALQQIKETRALPLIVAGKLLPALALVAHLWASLPGADYDQHEQTLINLTAWYVAAGGTLQ